MNKYMVDSKDEDKKDQFRSSSKEVSKVEDSIGDSQSLSQTKSGKNGDKQTESYDTDTFEEQSASQSKSLSVEGSASKKSGISYWPGKNAFESSNASNSASKDQIQKVEVFSANAMEEYLKKQANKQAT